MSCSGKTTFAKQLKDHKYYCFDALFHWHMIETFGLSIENNLKDISNTCQGDKYVLDGWHWSDQSHLPESSRVNVIYSSYDIIIDQYRVPVDRKDQHLSMYKKWYQGIDYQALGARYYRNDGKNFQETTYEMFQKETSAYI